MAKNIHKVKYLSKNESLFETVGMLTPFIYFRRLLQNTTKLALMLCVGASFVPTQSIGTRVFVEILHFTELYYFRTRAITFPI